MSGTQESAAQTWIASKSPATRYIYPGEITTTKASHGQQTNSGPLRMGIAMCVSPSSKNPSASLWIAQMPDHQETVAADMLAAGCTAQQISSVLMAMKV